MPNSNQNPANIVFSPEEFIKFCYRNLLEREVDKQGLKDWLEYFENNHDLEFVVSNFINSDEFITRQLWKINERVMQPILGKTTCIIGEKIPLNRDDLLSWYQKASQLIFDDKDEKISLNNQNLVVENKDDHQFTVAIINSLYKGRKYIKYFIENMVNQTIFPECQLIIIDAQSPENEKEIIEQYCLKFPNIKYIRSEEKIRIYDAWNFAINHSDTEFITNANVDDLHRKDALELKVKALRDNPDVDVAYSDVYYSFIPNFPFEKVAKCGLKSNLPIANKDNLMLFNSPHNAPLWRRSVHEKIGFFNNKYQSAADYEFWLRAVFSGVKFTKISQPVTLYYNNPHGISTDKDSLSIKEGEEIVEFYEELLDSNDNNSWDKYYALINETKKQQNSIKLDILKEEFRQKILILEDKNLQLNHHNHELKNKQDVLNNKYEELNQVQQKLELITNSNFWRMRSLWFKFKKFFRPNLQDELLIEIESCQEKIPDFENFKPVLDVNKLDYFDNLLKELNLDNSDEKLGLLEETIQQQSLNIEHQILNINNISDRILSVENKISEFRNVVKMIEQTNFWKLKKYW